MSSDKGLRRTGSNPTIPPLKLAATNARRLSQPPQSARLPESQKEEDEVRSVSARDDEDDMVTVTIAPFAATASQEDAEEETSSLFQCLMGAGMETEARRPWEPPSVTTSTPKRGSHRTTATSSSNNNNSSSIELVTGGIYLTVRKRQEYITAGEPVCFKSPWVQYEMRQIVEAYRERYGNGNERVRIPTTVYAILGLIGCGRMASRTELRQLLDFNSDDDGFVHHYVALLMREMMVGDYANLVTEMIDYCIRRSIPGKYLVRFYEMCTLPAVYKENQECILGWVHSMRCHIHRASLYIIRAALKNQNLPLYHLLTTKSEASDSEDEKEEEEEEHNVDVLQWEILQSGSEELMRQLSIFDNPEPAHARAIAHGGGPLSCFKRVMEHLSGRILSLEDKIILCNGVASGGSAAIFEYYLEHHAPTDDKDAILCLLLRCLAHRQYHFVQRLMEERGRYFDGARIAETLRDEERSGKSVADELERLPWTRADQMILRQRGCNKLTRNLLGWRAERRREYARCLELIEADAIEYETNIIPISTKKKQRKARSSTNK